MKTIIVGNTVICRYEFTDGHLFLKLSNDSLNVKKFSQVALENCCIQLISSYENVFFHTVSYLNV